MMHRHSITGLAAGLLLVLPPTILQASTIDALVADIAGNNEKARVRARQMLARERIEAVPKLLPLVVQDNELVWHAAFNVLADFANAVSAPGRQSERAIVTSHLMTLVAPSQPDTVRTRGLQLLTLVVPSGYDVAPIAALLNDPNLKERARATLTEIGTPEARKALCDHLAKADPDFQCAILDSLGRLQDAASLDAIDGLTSSNEPKARAAAVRAIAWTGNPIHLKTAKRVLAAADPATRPDALDALLRLLNTIADKGGNWQIAVNEYLELLNADSQVAREAGLAGLGRIGDGTCVGPILAAIKDADNPTWMIGIAALRNMQGVDVARSLVAAYPALPARTRLALIPVLGEKKHSLALPILREAVQSSDPAFRSTAIAALGNVGQPEAVELLIAAARNGTQDEKTAAITALLTLADGLRAGKKAKPAGGAYLAVLQASHDQPLLAHALDGLAACPVPEACGTVVTIAADKDLQHPAAKALIGIASSLAAAGQKEQALETYETVRRLNPSMAMAREVAKGMHALGAKVDLAAILGIVTHWWVLGPFELGEQNKGWNIDYLNREPNVKLTASYPSGDQKVTWKHAVSDDANGKINLRAAIADRDNCIGYAYTEITVSQDTDAVLLIGVDDSERIWLNGKKVYENFVARPLKIDQDRVSVKLKAGPNTILMKIWQNTLGWEFCMRITAPDGSPISFTQKTQ